MSSKCQQCGKEYADSVSAQLCKNIHSLIIDITVRDNSIKALSERLALVEQIKDERSMELVRARAFLGDDFKTCSFTSLGDLLGKLSRTELRNAKLVECLLTAHERQAALAAALEKLSLSAKIIVEGP